VATFTSASTFNNLVEMVGPESLDLLKKVTLAAIGPVTGKAIEKQGLRVTVMPARATVGDMVASIADWALSVNRRS